MPQRLQKVLTGSWTKAPIGTMPPPQAPQAPQPQPMGTWACHLQATKAETETPTPNLWHLRHKESVQRIHSHWLHHRLHHRLHHGLQHRLHHGLHLHLRLHHPQVWLNRRIGWQLHALRNGSGSKKINCPVDC